MATSAQNKIKLLNLRKDETRVNYSLLLIHGLIKHDDNCKEILVKLQSNNGERNFKSPIKDHQFKTLVELDLGQNRISLQTTGSDLLITCYYEPRKTDNIVLPLYVICDGHDGRFQAPNREESGVESACRRINVACKILQSFIAEKLNELELGRKTFQAIPCEPFRTKLTSDEAEKMSQQEVWEYLGREIMNSELGDKNRKYLVFLSCTRYHGECYDYDDQLATYEDLLKITTGYVALGGGGLAIFGTACLYTWPETVDEIRARFENSNEVNRRHFLDDSCYRGTEGACFSTTLGSVLHELCHTFDLGHTEKGIMGRGFDAIEKTFISSNNCGKLKTPSVSKTNRASIRKYKFSNEIADRPIKEDEIYFTKSSAAFLSYHKWFNSFENSLNSSITFDANLQLIKATSGIRVVEIRSDPDQLVRFSWLFTGKILKYHFQVPRTKFKTDCVLIVMDNVGNILRRTVEKINTENG